MSIIAIELEKLGERVDDGPLASEDATKLCKYGTLLAQVAKARSDDEPDEGLTPEELAQKAERLIAGMRAVRR